MSALDVVVVAYKSEDHIDECLEAARRIHDLGDVVVVDNNVDNRGFGAGQNAGARQTAHEFLLLLNPDATVVPDAITRGVALLKADASIGAVQGGIVNRATGALERSQGVALGPVHLLGRALGLRRLLGVGPVRALARRIPALADHVERLPEEPVDVDSLAATALLVRRSAFEAVDGFDERFFLYGEDLDLCRRLRDRGWRLVAVPDVWAFHVSGASSGDSVDRERRWWAGTLQYAAVWWSPVALGVGVVAALLAWMRVALREPRSAGAAWQEMVRGPLRQRRNKS